MKRQDTSTRSTLSIDAVAQAAAQGGLPAAPALGKITAIAGLAGFVLRLFRRSGNDGGAKAVRRQSERQAEPERCGSGGDTKPERSPSGARPKAGPPGGARRGRSAPAGRREGGRRHG